jgi:hypothetical protein
MCLAIEVRDRRSSIPIRFEANALALHRGVRCPPPKGAEDEPRVSRKPPDVLSVRWRGCFSFEFAFSCSCLFFQIGLEPGLVAVVFLLFRSMRFVRNESWSHPHSMDENDCLRFAIHAQHPGARHLLCEFLVRPIEISPFRASWQNR